MRHALVATLASAALARRQQDAAAVVLVLRRHEFVAVFEDALKKTPSTRFIGRAEARRVEKRSALRATAIALINSSGLMIEFAFDSLIFIQYRNIRIFVSNDV